MVQTDVSHICLSVRVRYVGEMVSEALLLPLASVQFGHRHNISSNVTNTYKVRNVKM